MPDDTSEDQARIGDVLVRYATGIDRRDWPLLRGCWTDDAEADYGAYGSFGDPEALTAAMSATHDGMGPTYHRITNVVADVDGDRATARSYVHAVLMIRPGDADAWVETVGHYDDELVRTPAGWRIRRRIAVTARTVMSGAVTA